MVALPSRPAVEEEPSFLSASMLESFSAKSVNLHCSSGASLSSSSSSLDSDSTSSSSEPSSPEHSTSALPSSPSAVSCLFNSSPWPTTALALFLAVLARYLTLWQAVSVGAATLGVILAKASSLGVRVRSLVQPLVLRKVVSGSQTVAAIQKLRHPVLDKLMCALAMTVSIEFYTAFLPLLFFSGRVDLGISVAILLALCIYFGNSAKDLVCAPRPFTPPAMRVMWSTLELHNSKEYGLPSTHTINSVALSLYMLHWLHERSEISPVYGPYIVAALFLVTLMVIFGRLYLGMHSPIDVAAGLALGLILTAAWTSVDSAVLHFLRSGQSVVLFCTIVCLFTLVAYPEPQDSTPSFEDHTAFVGVILGLCIAVSSNPWGAASFLPLSSSSALILLKRLAVGLPLALASKCLGKEIFKQVLPLLMPAFGIPFTSKKYVPWLQQGRCGGTKGVDERGGMSSEQQPKTSNVKGSHFQQESFDIDILIRLVQYASLAWSVQFLSPGLFNLFKL